MKHVLALLAAVALAGCAALSALNPFSGKPSVDVTAGVGRTVNQEKSAISAEQGNQSAETITNDSRVQADSVSQVIQQMPPWMFLVVCLLAGWAIPSPGACVRGVCGLFNRSRP